MGCFGGGLGYFFVCFSVWSSPFNPCQCNKESQGHDA